MKLSEAVRMGSQWADCHGPVFRGDACCAYGGIIKAYASEKKKNYFLIDPSTIEKAYPLLGSRAIHPVTNQVTFVHDIIVNLFEGSRWSKSAIAEWVETIEKKLDAERANTTSPADASVESAKAEVGLPAVLST